MKDRNSELPEDLTKFTDELSRRIDTTAENTATVSGNFSTELAGKIEKLGSLVQKQADSLGINNFIEKMNKDHNKIRFKQIYVALGKREKIEELNIKASFLKAILSGDEDLLIKSLKEAGLLNFSRDKALLNMKKKKDDLVVPKLMALIQVTVASEDENDLLTILMKIFQSIPEQSLDREAKTIDMKTKKKLLLKMIEGTEPAKAKSVLSQLTDISFDASLPSFNPALGDANYVNISLNIKNYLALIGDKTDISEFLLLSIGFMTSNDLADATFLQEISVDYLFVKYDECCEKILAYLSKKEVYEKLESLQKNSLSQIIAAAKNLRVYDCTYNNPRRFFETRLAQYINGISNSENTIKNIKDNKIKGAINDHERLKNETINAATNILKFFLGKNGSVKNPQDMEQKICIFANGYKDTTKFTTEEITFIHSVLATAEAYKGRDRVIRAPETGILERKFETDPDKVGASVWNSAGGVMQGNSPTFYDAQCNPLRNMLVDSSRCADKDSSKSQWFWNNNRHYSSYVGSISGHTCHIIGMLNKYMTKNNTNPNLEKNINLFLVQIIAVYAKRGFHSMLEIMDIIHDPYIQEIFATHKIKVNLYDYFKKPENADFLRYAINDCTAYTCVLVSKAQIKESLTTDANRLL